jgi:hypothetical protein
MQFLILISSDEKAKAKATVEQQKEVMTAYMKYSEDLGAAGAMKGGEALEPSSKLSARITFKEGRRVVIDGPFAEAKEVVGGFYIIDVKTREEAVEWAAKCPGAKYGTVELREVMTFPQ